MPLISRWIGAALVVLAVISSWPAAARQASAPTLDDQISQQLRHERAVAWASGRPLTWTDFAGTPPDAAGQQGAVTAYSLFHGARCTGRKFQFTVVTAFLPGQSWVRPIVLSDPARNASALRHEQTHFDLAEVFARRMRRRFAELPNPCRETPQALEAIASGFVTDDFAAQTRYDDETRHGLIADHQHKWDVDTADLLASLGTFARR